MNINPIAKILCLCLLCCRALPAQAPACDRACLEGIMDQ
jgi:hypothetical protein